MKKPDPEQWWRAKRLQAAQTRHGLRKSAQRRARRLRHGASIAAQRTSIRVYVPERLRYYARRDQRRPVEHFFDHVDELLQSGKRVVLDFSQVEALYPCGVLILMGWVDEWTEKHRASISATYPTNDLVEQMLQHVEVLQKLGLTARKEVNHNDVTRWHYFHGTNADATQIEPFMLDLQKLLGEEKQLGLGNCITEAMINVGHHAYAGDAGGPWWIFATISEKRVFIALYDRGSSVPATLLSKPGIMDVLSGRLWAIGRGDSRLITAAIGGRTRTQLPYRGKGLPEMLEFTKAFDNSELGIFSRNGFFRYDKSESSGNLRTPIKGTLVIWMLNIAAVRNE